MSDPVCWCASDVKCPHAISGKLPLMWDEIEKTIDDVLHQFDRRAVKKFLKRDIDGHNKGTHKSSGQLKEAYNIDPNAVHTMTDVEASDMKKQRHSPADLESTNPLSMRPRPELTDDFSRNTGATPAKTRPGTSVSVDMESQDYDGATDADSDFQYQGGARTSSSPMVARVKGLQKVSKSMEQLPKNGNRNVEMSKTMPAGGMAAANRPRSGSKAGKRGSTAGAATMGGIQPGAEGMDNNVQLPESTAITMGLLRIGDILSRKVLPWQAAFCPRAVENLRDCRCMLVSQKHESFVQRMTKQLENKVLEFLEKKDEEVDTWIQLEVDKWHKAMSDEEEVQMDFFQADEQRLCKRSGDQEGAQRSREMTLAAALDDQEREATREQLINFRRLCRTEARADVRALHASIEVAKTKATAQTTVTQRDLLRRQEEAHDWLCCVSDNAVTAQESELVLKCLYDNLDLERTRALTSLQSALATYKQQYDMIYEAITVFHGKVHQHANDYLRREQLVSRAFLQYLTSIINGEIKPHTSDVRKKNVAWEGKFTIDRSTKRDHQMSTDFNMCIAPFEQKVEELRTRMRVQRDQITVKMQSILNGRDNDVNKRKTTIHKKLARYVKKVCNDRRIRLKDSAAARLEEYSLEEKCVNTVSEIISELRTDIDQMWVKEHIRERRMYEAVGGRMERLEKSSLLIWNRHAHLAVSEKEEYQDWLEAFEKARFTALKENRLRNLQDYKNWRKVFANVGRGLLTDMRRPMKRYIEGAQDFDPKQPLEGNMLELEKRRRNISDKLAEIVGNLSSALDGFVTTELNKSNEYYRMGRENLVLDWQVNLHRLNNGINRRVGSLKGMEKDLEETIRLTLAQHEIEACVFEQASCARVETFWTKWRDRVGQLGKQLKEAMEDFRIAKSTDRVKVRTSVKDRQLDELLMHPEHADDGHGNGRLPAISGTRKHGSSRGLLGDGPASDTKQLPSINQTQAPSQDVDENMLSDTARLKSILDEVRSEVYVEFTRKNTRGFEIVRKNHGEGRKRTVPPFMLAKVLMSAADSFWDRAKMSERCMGRITSRGMRIFMTGLPRHARAMFCVATALVAIASVPLRDTTRLDPDEVVAFLEQGVKRIFLTAMLSITVQYGSFGDYMLQQECVWSCTSCRVAPPMDPGEMDVDFSGHPVEADPIDIVNSLLSIPEFASEEAQMRAMLSSGAAASGTGETLGEQLGMGEDVMDITEDTMAGLAAQGRDVNFAGQGTNTNPLDSLVNTISVGEFMDRMGNVAPLSDIAALLALLGRHNSTVEVTYHRYFQATYIWRKVAMSMLTAILDPPGSEYTRLPDLINIHVVNKAGKRKVGLCDASCISPFEGVTNTLDWISSINGCPLSMLQSIAMVTRSGNVDPWLEDLKQSCRSVRFSYELTEMMDSYVCKDYEHLPNQPFQASFQSDVAQVVKDYDVNGAGTIPLELLRTYIQKDDAELNNAQITCVYWCICRCSGEAETFLQQLQPDEKDVNTVNSTVDGTASSGNGGGPLPESYSLDFASNVSQEPTIVKRTIRPEFFGDVQSYVGKFRDELQAVIETMPQLDTNVVVGLLTSPLNPVDAHQIVSDAMKLDVSARNGTPSSTCVWLGLRMLPLEKAVDAVSIPTRIAEEGQEIESEMVNANPGDRFIGPGLLMKNTSTTVKQRDAMQNQAFIECRLLEIRMKLEIEVLTKFPIICERRASDMSYGAGGDQINCEDHFKELTKRRLDRVDKLTVAWRQTMMNEWATSLYQSRQHRYHQRADVVRNCIQVYQDQYAKLKSTIVDERQEVMTNYTRLLAEAAEFEEEDHQTLSFHTDFLSYTVNMFSNKLLELVRIVNDALEEFQRHAGNVKRKSLLRVKNAADNMRTDLELSCKGLIEGYTGGYAQKHFDELLFRGERWRTNFTTFHGTIIVAKEKFAASKKAMDDEVMQQITDRISMDRNRTKKLLERLNNESLFFHESLNTLKSNGSELMKDANQRIMLRIERAVRECKKLRSAAEKDAQLENHVLAEIRIVLSEARTQSIGIVTGIRDTCKNQLDTVEPRRVVHRERMEDRTKEARKGWDELDELLTPLTENYAKSVRQTMGVLKSKCMDSSNQYKDEEIQLLQEEYMAERKQLISSFREHFTDYDLSEAQIFERFNIEVNGAVNDIRSTWGSNNPLWLRKAMKEANDVSDSFIKNINDTVKKQIVTNPKMCDDDTVLTRVEIADTLGNSLKTLEELTTVMPEQFADEKRLQITQIKNRGMKNNNDMIRPQVVAVTDLLLSGIQIDHDFEMGYDALKLASNKKSLQINEEIDAFINKYLDPEQPESITFTERACEKRLEMRREEVTAMINASTAHILADHSKLEVELQQGYSDTEQWNELTLQLVRGAFDAAVEKYLEPIWPSPEGTPRDETEPDDIDRVEKIKTLLLANYEANLTEENSMVIRDEDLGKLKDPATTRELQEGWLECCTDDMVVYFFNQETGESLWDLPAMLKIPKYPDPDPSGAGFLETPRELVVGEYAAGATVPTEVAVTAGKFQKRFRGDVDVTMLITDVMGLAGLVVQNCMDTAVEITEVLKNPGKKRPKTPEELPDIINAPEDAGITDYLAQLVGEDEFETLKAAREKAARDALLAAENLSPAEQLLATQKLATGDALADSSRRDAAEEEVGTEWLNFAMEPSVEEQEAEERANEEAAAKAKSVADRKKAARGGVGAQKPLLSADPTNLIESVKTIAAGIVEDPRVKNFATLAPQIEAVVSTVSTLGEGITVHVANKVDSFVAETFPVGVTISAEETEQVRFELKQQIYRQTRENDQMQREDAEAQALQVIIQNSLRENFSYSLSDVLQSERIFPEQVAYLRDMTYYMHVKVVNEVLEEYGTSWVSLDDRVAATLIAVQQEKDAAEATRQATIIEFRDDIDEMYDFFRKVGLSKTVSKKAATECIANHITTSKKLAKVWSKQGITMRDLTLDDEDGEEVEAALKQLLMESSASAMDLSWYDNSQAMQQQKDQLELQKSLVTTGPSSSVASVHSFGQALEQRSAELPSADDQQYQAVVPYDPAASIPTVGSVEQRSSSPQGSSATGSYSKPASRNGLSKFDTHYQSFEGGWIECSDDQGNVYYYNTNSGMSSWDHPGTKAVTPMPLQLAYEATSPFVGQEEPAAAPTTSALAVYNHDHDYNETDERAEELVQDPRELQFPIPRMLLPVPVTEEADQWSKDEGVKRQMGLLAAQDKWQTQLSKLEGIFEEQRSLFAKSKDDLFNKITLRVETRMGVFVDDIKYMQRALKQELAELESSGRDLRRLFDDENSQILMAEKLSFIMEGMDKLKSTASTRYEGAIKQMDKFLHDWVLIETELNQVGDIYDETVESNLEQCKLQCEHVVKVFTYEQLKAATGTKKLELSLFRKSLSDLSMSDTYDNEYYRNLPCAQQKERYHKKERVLMHERWEYQQYELQRCLDEGFSDELEQIKERFEYEATLPIFVPFFKGDGIPEEEGGWDAEEDYEMPEEERVMSFLLTEVEMEAALADDYDSITAATKTMSLELNEGLQKFDAREKLLTEEEGSWFNKHRDTVKRHATALHTTLQRIRTKVMEGYRLLNSKLEALDFDVEQAAEAELAGMSSPSKVPAIAEGVEEDDIGEAYEAGDDDM